MPPLVDVLLAAAFVAATIAEALTSDVASPRTHVLLAVPAMAALAWRRRFPIAVAAITVSSNLAVNPQGQFSTLLAIVLVSFTVGAETDRPRSWVGLAVAAVPFLAGLALEGMEPSDVAAAVVFLFGPWAVGSMFRQRSARTAEAVDRAARVEQEREARVAAAAAQERVRIARELHDIVSHSISVVTIQTQAVRRRLGPEHEREARDLEAVETTARQALAEMRRIFGVLRSEGESPPLSPQPGLGELDRLVEQVRAAGLVVELRVEGERTELPPGLDLAAYRIVQEGLTNTLRHAQARQARVTLRYRPGRVEVLVEDDGRAAHADRGGTDGTGHGLVGVRERVALYGGTVEAGPAASGFRLAAVLPVGEGR